MMTFTWCKRGIGVYQVLQVGLPQALRGDNGYQTPLPLLLLAYKMTLVNLAPTKKTGAI